MRAGIMGFSFLAIADISNNHYYNYNSTIAMPYNNTTKLEIISQPIV